MDRSFRFYEPQYLQALLALINQTAADQSGLCESLQKASVKSASGGPTSKFHDPLLIDFCRLIRTNLGRLFFLAKGSKAIEAFFALAPSKLHGVGGSGISCHLRRRRRASASGVM